MPTEPFYIEPRYGDDLIWIAVDLDDTLAHPVWPHPGIGEPIEENIAKLYPLIDAGYKPFIYTSRHWSDLEMIRAWIIEHDIPVHKHRIICGKPLVKLFIDDKAINAEAEEWL